MPEQYYIVKKEVVPEIYSKVIDAKKLIQSGTARSINEAVQMVGISRGAFYKYKDSIYLESEVSKKSIVTLSLLLQHIPGVLSNLLNIIAEWKGNILTINQNIPINDIANATVTFEYNPQDMDLDRLICAIKKVDGIIEVNIIGRQ
ncbi:MAG: ACT domain-containing protein [Clostridiales bacterium]|nr:ACT domain-containing protein [Clostridiales bacterium]